MKKSEFKARYNIVAAIIMFNQALERGDLKGAEEIAEICILAQEETNWDKLC